jgi:hypothetical protein
MTLTKEPSGRLLLPQTPQARFTLTRGFLRLETEALRNGDDVI